MGTPLYCFWKINAQSFVFRFLQCSDLYYYLFLLWQVHRLPKNILYCTPRFLFLFQWPNSYKLMALRYICFVKVLLKEQIFTILFLLICIDDCSWQVSWINSGVLSCRFSQCMLNLEKMLEKNLVELENIIIWKTLEQNSWFFSFSVFELVLVTACGRADARNFEFNEIRVLNIGNTASYLCLKSIQTSNVFIF